MRSLTGHLGQYAAYHRDRRNIATHLIGIPMIVLAITILLSRPAMAVAGLVISPAIVAAVAAATFYLSLDLRFGTAMALLLVLAVWIGGAVAALPTAQWLAAGIGLFVIGWIVQFVGHHYEGRKPAFLDDLIGLIVGPLFIVAELAFMLGLRNEVRREVEARAADR